MTKTGALARPVKKQEVWLVIEFDAGAASSVEAVYDSEEKAKTEARRLQIKNKNPFKEFLWNGPYTVN